MGYTQRQIIDLLREHGKMSFIAICEHLDNFVQERRVRIAIDRLASDDLVTFDGTHYKIKTVFEKNRPEYRWDF